MKRQYSCRFFLPALMIIALGSLWISQAMHEKRIAASKLAHVGPDYFVEKFSYLIPSAKHLCSTLSGELLVHSPNDNSLYIQKPFILSLDGKYLTTTMRADIAKIEDRDNKLCLYGHVRVEKRGNLGRSLQLRSQYLRVLLETHSMQSSRFVRLRMGTLALSGNGISLNETKKLSKFAREKYGLPVRDYSNKSIELVVYV